MAKCRPRKHYSPEIVRPPRKLIQILLKNGYLVALENQYFILLESQYIFRQKHDIFSLGNQYGGRQKIDIKTQRTRQ